MPTYRVSSLRKTNEFNFYEATPAVKDNTQRRKLTAIIDGKSSLHLHNNPKCIFSSTPAVKEHYGTGESHRYHRKEVAGSASQESEKAFGESRKNYMNVYKSEDNTPYWDNYVFYSKHKSI